MSDFLVSDASPGASRVAVVARGGNSRLRRGEPLDAGCRARAAQRAARLIGRAAGSHRFVVTHGNGPQIGLLVLIPPCAALLMVYAG